MHLYLFVWIAMLLVFFPTPLHAEEDLWKVLEVIRLSGTLIPNFTLPSLDGKSYTLGDLKGKVVFINFWATWCPSCREEMPSMERLYRKFKDKAFTILAVDIMERPETVERFVRKYKISFPILLDASGEISRQYRAISIPVTYIVDKRGKAVGKILGPRKWDDEHAQAFLRKLLEK